jgi:glycosyltransferase involved in cell wall biosynthesis
VRVPIERFESDPQISMSDASPSAFSSSPQPLVSIIVPTFNRAHFLERCLRSILDQSYRNLECLVMDGGSTDGSIDILKKLAVVDSRLRFISEKDNGEVFAVNRGLDLIQGEIYGIQASDDYYVPDAVEQAVRFLLQHPEFAGVGGDALFVDGDGKPLNRGMITYRGPMADLYIRRILILRYEMSPLPHGSFIGWRKRVMSEGKFDPAFSAVSDLEFYLRLLARGERIGCLPRVQLYYTIHADMGAVKYRRKVLQQLRLIYDRYQLRWYHQFLRLTFGRFASYFGNPYRTRFVPGVAQELRQWLASRSS